MNRDPLFRKIDSALNHVNNDDAFEQCMCELLRENVNPTITNIRGGKDDVDAIDKEGAG